MKLLILIIYNKNDIFDRMLELQRKYIHNNENIDAYFITLNEEQGEDIVLIDDIIYIKGQEGFLNILYKTNQALHYLINILNKEYDYVVRTNISTNIYFKNLISYLETAPRTMFYSGGFHLTLLWPLALHEIIEEKQQDRYSYYGLKFMQGTSIILSFDVAKIILDYNNEDKYDIVDDVKIALLIKKLLPDVYSNFLNNIAYANISYCFLTENCVFVRNNSPTDRMFDISNMSNIVANLEKYETKI